ncbi:hypothetical protein [Pseudomonas brassicacearum]|uniref:hypothetical protein n=1 Tax=Pseudomonas brassicacearum TaxID=930166 RepID=UPI0011F3FE3D|nr:hypothetical protein [Pseudomonas brassicacearum]QEO78809.1 hypothetical protein ELZ14_15030 [Pseudomonas brassicacearum]
MKNLLFLFLYLGGGVLLYRWIELLRPAGEGLDFFYSWVLLDTNHEVAIRQCLSFIYASFFHLGWAALFSEPAKTWVHTVTKGNVVYLFFRSAAFLISCLLILGLVGVGLAKRPYSPFHQYFSLLVTCMLLGGWAWSLKDFILAVLNVMGRKSK